MRFDCNPNAKGMWCLEQLAAGPKARLEIVELGARRYAKASDAKSIPQVIGALQACRLVNYDRREYLITADGLAVLERLRAGETIYLEPTPGSMTPKAKSVETSVRVFGHGDAA